MSLLKIELKTFLPRKARVWKVFHIKNRSFLTSCVFWLVFLNARLKTKSECCLTAATPPSRISSLDTCPCSVWLELKTCVQLRSALCLTIICAQYSPPCVCVCLFGTNLSSACNAVPLITDVKCICKYESDDHPNFCAIEPGLKH